MTIGEQLSRIYYDRLASIGSSLNETAIEIAERMKENTNANRAFGNDPYNDTYSKRYERWREKNGLKGGKVTLRAKKMRIERTTEPASYASPADKGVELGFVEGGEIFRYHHKGTAKGGKIRSIFPKEMASIPSDIFQRMVHNIVGALRG